jgi:hypothetical protein
MCSKRAVSSRVELRGSWPVSNEHLRQRVFRRILEREAGPAPDAPILATAAGRLWERLARQLVPLIGDAGVAAIYARGLHLAQRQVPGLAPVPTLEHEDGPFARAHDFLAHQEPAVAADVAIAFLTAVCELLASFIGGRLTTGLLHEAWPDDFAADSTRETIA